ncbi:hypothetical protein ODJ79_15190 [Actinoplanes sp. KI2]|uniref:hypothetical protein n=1 Tax=Actinoplanes sp. KI2 TaxID=2983315 RepID=UPI0021D58C10|nr:hypothetical protein [Actinoplanes sp. KI2]MCU7725070.1 hypothetical protein [Actinoplanes sp. KI2]
MNHDHPIRRLGALALTAAAALALVTACSGSDDKPEGSAAQAAANGTEPKTIDGAKAAAQTVFDRFASGDYAGTWDMYTAAGQAAISRDDFVKLNDACSRRGLAIQLTGARMDDADHAIVIAKQMAATQSYTMVYENNAWRLEPAKQGLALYRLGVAKAIAAQKLSGTCAGQQ